MPISQKGSKPFLVKALRKLPAISRRDNLIADLRKRIAYQKDFNSASFVGPSFIRLLNQEVRAEDDFINISRGDTLAHTGWKLTKSGAKELAEAVGYKTPEHYGTWESLEQVPFDALPNAFVLKSDSGSYSRGVLPLIRNGRQWKVANSTTEGDLETLLEPLKENLAADRIKGPFHAEQLLGSPEKNLLSHDIKVYAFYGQPAIIWVRKILDYFGGIDTKRSAFFDVNGERVHNINAVTKIDDTIPLPKFFDKILTAASDFSHTVRLPHVRVDLYEHEGEIYLGELTPRCGHRRVYSFGSPWDEYLGTLWENAQVRLMTDLAIGNINTSGPMVRTGSTPIQKGLFKPPIN